MPVPELHFPLRVDFGAELYWIEDEGPFQIGEAVAEFFADNTFGLHGDEFFALSRELGAQLAAYGGASRPFAPGLTPTELSPDILFAPERAAVTAPVCYTFHAVEGDVVELVERYVFERVRDFLYVELFKGLRIGNAPRQCRLCKRWFFHQSSEKYMYCTRVVRGEETRTCREIGALAAFEDKVAENEPWKLYKRAYKKYYARFMKGRMSREELASWTAIAAALRDETEELWRAAESQEEKAAIIERYRGQLNCI